MIIMGPITQTFNTPIIGLNYNDREVNDYYCSNYDYNIHVYISWQRIIEGGKLCI